MNDPTTTTTENATAPTFTNEAPAPDAGATQAEDGASFDSVERALRDAGPDAALKRLAEQLETEGNYRALLDALLLRARHELELPLIASGPLSDLPEPTRERFEERYVDAVRLIGGKYLAAGDIPTAWAYFRAIGETDDVARALDAYQPNGDENALGTIVEVAFNHGANPRRGFELILDNYGVCSAITAFEQLPGHDEGVRAACAERLIERLHDDLSANVRSEITSRGQLAPVPDATLAQMIDGRPWLFADEGYHIDISHLSSVVRMSVLVSNLEALARALDLTEYGRRLSPRLQFEGVPPFENTFEDHGMFLSALLGRDLDAAIAHFRAKLPPPGPPEDAEATVPAQTLVNLLARVGRAETALEIAREHLAGMPESALFCPSAAQLCQRLNDPERLAAIAREQHDLVNYTAALLMAPSEKS